MKPNINYRFKNNDIINIEQCYKLLTDKVNIKENQIYKIHSDSCGNLLVKTCSPNDNKCIEKLEKDLHYFSKVKKIIDDDICPNFLYMYERHNNSLLFEYANGNLISFFKNVELSDELLYNMIFQILIGILVLQKVLKIFHNNLNLENIFYKKISTDVYKYFKYNINGVDYIIKNLGYLFVIGDFTHANELDILKKQADKANKVNKKLDRFNELDKKDIEFGLDYNYDFEYLSNIYYNIVVIILSQIFDLPEYIIKKYKLEDNVIVSNMLKQLKQQINDNDFDIKTRNKILKKRLLHYLVETNIIDWKTTIEKSKYFLPSDNIKTLIEQIFLSKESIDKIIFENFNKLFNSDNKNKDNIKEFNIKYTDNNSVMPITKHNLSRQNPNFFINKIKQLYNVDRVNFYSFNNYFLDPNKNYSPHLLKPMYVDIQPYDYIEPIKRLNNLYPNKYYEHLIKNFNTESNVRLDKQINKNSKLEELDYDEIILQYVKCRQKCFVITLWPLLSNWVEDAVKYLEPYGNIYYVKNIELTPNGLMNYLCMVYDQFTKDQIYKVVKDKFVWTGMSKDKPSTISIIIFDNINNVNIAGTGSKFKTEFRNWATEILKNDNPEFYEKHNTRGNDLIHINDFFNQTKEYCELIFNKNSLSMIDNSLYMKTLDKFYDSTFLKIETLRKSMYTNINLDIMNSLMVIGGSALYFYGIRPIEDLDGVCFNYKNISSNNQNNQDNYSQQINKICKLYADDHTKIDFIEYGVTNTKYWKDSWNKKNNELVNYFGVDNFDDLCWNPKYHFYYKGVKSYNINFEFFKKLQRCSYKNKDEITEGSWKTMAKDYTDFIMINKLIPEIIKDFIYINDNNKFIVSDFMINIYPNLKKLPFDDKIIKYIQSYFVSKYGPYKVSLTDDYIKSLFD